jgi:signal transduction histidine kinase
MEATGERTRALRAIDRKESRLHGATLVVLALCAAGVVVSDVGPGRGWRALLLTGLVGGYAADFVVRTRRLRAARRDVERGVDERRALLRRVGELTDFVNALRSLDEAPDEQTLAERLAAEAQRLCAADGAFVVARDAGGRAALVAEPRLGPDAALTDDERRKWDAWFEQGATPTLYADPTTAATRFGYGALLDGARSLVVAPLSANGKVFGALGVVRRVAGAPGFDLGALQSLGLMADAAGRVAAARDARRRARRERRRVELSLQRLSRAQAELVRSEKSRAVADLVTGVSHELNNPLTAMLGYAQLLARRPETAEGPTAEWIRELVREAERCAETLRKLSTFSRRAAAEGESRAPLAAVVRDVLALKAYDLRAAGVAARVDVPEDLPAPAMDRSLLQHVFLNLVNNACAAVRGAPRREIAISAAPSEAGLTVRVADTGPGVPPALRERVFDPFFTTRGSEEASGLGLTTCRELLVKAGGAIRVDDDTPVGAGAAFVLDVPAEAAAEAVAAA